MIGLTVLALLVFYVFALGKLARFIGRLAGFDESAVKVGAVFFILLVLPFVDEIVGRIQFQHECRKVEGYTVTEAIKTSRMARYANELGTKERVSGFIPIIKRTAVLIDVKSGAVLLSFATVSTDGGWVMRAGLNMGDSTFCNSVNESQIMVRHGFRVVEGGFFEQVSGRE